MRLRITLAPAAATNTSGKENHKRSETETDPITRILHTPRYPERDMKDIESDLDSGSGIFNIRNNESSLSNNNNVNLSKLVHSSSRVNESSVGSGVLRYALHLRFLCSSTTKKCSKAVRRCKSDPLSAPAGNMNMEGERRFYLYNDMRVVFPQRQSDADEGQVNCVFFFVFAKTSIFHCL